MTVFESDDVTHLHTCLSTKTYFRFPQDCTGGGLDHINKPSSDEGDNNKEEPEVLHQVQSSHRLHRPPQVSSCTDRFALPPSPSSPMCHTSIPTINSFSGSTPTVPTDPLRPGGSFASLSSLPPKIWDSVWVSYPGCYQGQLSSLQPRAKQAYRLAADDNRGDGLHLTG